MNFEREKCKALIDGLKERESSIENQRELNDSKLLKFMETFEEYMIKDPLFDDLNLGPVYVSNRQTFYSDISVTAVDQVVVYTTLYWHIHGRYALKYDQWGVDKFYYHLKHDPTAPLRAREDWPPERADSYEVTYKRMREVYFEDNYLIPSKVLLWFNRIIESCVPVYNRNRASSSRVRIRGVNEDSFIVLEINNSENQVINFSLVPVFNYCLKEPLDTSIEASLLTSEAMLVPKPYDFRNSRRAANLTNEEKKEIERLWLTVNSDGERNLINKCCCAKQVIKLLKLLREKEGWVRLDKYCLKTIVMSNIVQLSDQDLWGEDLLVKRLNGALLTLKNCLYTRSLDDVYLKENMFEKMRFDPLFDNRKEVDNIIARIDELLKIIRDDHVDSVKRLKDVFL